jgi:hypothetical protein
MVPWLKESEKHYTSQLYEGYASGTYFINLNLIMLSPWKHEEGKANPVHVLMTA